MRVEIKQALLVVIAVSVVSAALLTGKSILDFSRTGPTIQEEIIQNFSGYAAYSLARLSFFAFLITAYLSGIGVALYCLLTLAKGWRFRWHFAFVAGGLSFSLFTVLQFCRHLLYIPSSIVASSQYRNSRFYPLWEQLSPERLELIQLGLSSVIAAILIFSFLKMLKENRWQIAASSLAVGLMFCVVFVLSTGAFIADKEAKTTLKSEQPNIILIGSDTLRADRLGSFGYKRDLTPFIDNFAKRGVSFKNFFVPVARTAPSLTTFMTGTWPHTHKIRGNYNELEKTALPVASLPALLKEAGYRTEAITDWAGADLGKMQFGFDRYDGPEDQWNLKYLLRQGPKDIRLFLTLFTHNQFGKYFLPELYYLAGVPLNDELEQQAKRRITELSRGESPFFLTLFTSSTHIPFGSQYPYYKMYADPEYQGDSKFSMSGLTTPSEIIKKQEQDKHAFDVQQVVDLYDGTVRSFDDLVSGVVQHIEMSGLSDNTIIVLFSDHGVDLFERHTWGQGNSVMGDDPSARVPLVMVGPGIPSGKEVDKTTRSVDLAPTLLSLIGLSIPETVEGVSLRPYFDNLEEELDLPAFFETGVWLSPMVVIKSDHLKYPSLLELLEVPDKEKGTLVIKKKYRGIVIEARDRMIRTDRWKLVYLPMKKGARYWLYDLDNDPQGNKDVSEQNPDMLKKMKLRLVDWMKKDRSMKWENEHLLAE